MPIYEYHCDQCAHEFEHFQKATDETTATCSRCGGEVRRIVSRTSFALKGSGWYRDGYATSSSAQGKTSGEKKADVPAKQETKKEPGPPAKKGSS